jgi:glycosyltransferase involved in cell wall biosynthesis
VRTEVGDIPITVQPMPTDTSGFVSPSHGGGGVVTIGRLSAQKRIGDLIDAMRVLRDRGTEVPLTIVGDGVERVALESRARDSSIDARFVGRVPTTELPECLDGMDVCVMPAEREGLGLAAIEALIAGVPVVVTEAGGGLLDVVGEGDHGRVVPARQPEALADAVETFLDNPLARAAAAAAGKEWRAALDPDVVAQSFERIYESVAGQVRE